MKRSKVSQKNKETQDEKDSDTLLSSVTLACRATLSGMANLGCGGSNAYCHCQVVGCIEYLQHSVVPWIDVEKNIDTRIE